MTQRKAYNSRWSEEETFALVEARAAFDQQFKKKTSQFHVIWRQIRTSRQELSSRTSQECTKKWNNLLDIFKRLKDPKTGTAPTTTNADNWPYFSLINDFMSQKHTIIPSDRIDSASTSEVNLEEFEPFELEEEHLLSESEFSIAMAELQPSTSTTVRVPTSAKKKKQTMLDHVKQRDGKIMKSIKKNNKIIKKVVIKYFPDVVISSSSDTD